MSQLPDESKVRIETLLQKAAQDVDFRYQLLNNTDEVLAGSDLSGDEQDAVRKLRRVSLEELGVDVRPFRTVLRDNGAKMSALSVAVAAQSKE